MKFNTLSYSVAALLGYTRAAEEGYTITYANSLKCGQCIKGGYIFCTQGADGETVASGSSAATATCCQDAQNCAALSDQSYTCSTTYSDAEFAMSMCP